MTDKKCDLAPFVIIGRLIRHALTEKILACEDGELDKIEAYEEAILLIQNIIPEIDE